MPLPLSGLRILAISQYGAGPFATLHLADLGAEVIKIEDPTSGGDISRTVPPYAVEGDSLFFQSLNRNKKSITLNLKHPDGYAAFRDLARVADAVFNNLRGDLPARLRLMYQDLKDVNPRLVCCSLSGFGTTGPRAKDPGYDYLVQAEAGYMALTGDPDSPPTRAGVSIVDFSAGYAAAMALLVGLLQAQRTGQGADLQISLLDSAVSMLNYLAAWHLNQGYEPERLPDSAHPSLVPSQVFRTGDGHLMVMCNKEKFWQNLCDRLEAPELRDDLRFRTFADRLEHRDELIPLLQQRFQEHPTAYWLERLQGHVPISPVNDFATAIEQIARRPDAPLPRFDHPTFGSLSTLPCPVRVDGATPAYVRGPRLGEHTDAILQEYLGYEPDRIDALRQAGAI
jgi:crotonobetainyl-CoA:carnitine CoA-transferase CaiB-like acyl-CoA transferase